MYSVIKINHQNTLCIYHTIIELPNLTINVVHVLVLLSTRGTLVHVQQNDQSHIELI